MDYRTFKDRFSDVPIIQSKYVLQRAGQDHKDPLGRQALLNQLSRWQRRGLLVNLKKGIYLLNKGDRRIEPSNMYLANQLYAPSYVSLEYALSFHGLIPERVHEVTSVTTKKTARISNEFARFSYRHVVPSAFRGFKIIKDQNGLDVFMAEPEKAVLDFLYFTFSRNSKIAEQSPDVFNESYRFEDVSTLKEKRILELAQYYRNTNLSAAAKLFCMFRRENIKK